MFYRLKLNSKVVQANQEEPAKRKIQEFIEDETLIKVGNQFAWLLWIAVDSINKLILLRIYISFERTILVAKRFLNSFVRKYGKHSLSIDVVTWYSYTLVNS